MATIATNPGAVLRMSAIAPQFLTYAAVERGFAPQTISKYTDCLRQIGKMIGDLPVPDYGKEHVMALKAAMLAKGHSCGRQLSILAAFKGLLLFCQSERGLEVLNPELVTLPKRPRREVGYLTTAEVECFVAAIDLQNDDGKPFEAGVRFRALVEVLLGSAMRISEVLSLNRTDVDFETREARVIGKGNKQRTVFFTDRALGWIRRYLEIRHDTHPALFVTQPH
jgi:site-specific recombinase XerD